MKLGFEQVSTQGLAEQVARLQGLVERGLIDPKIGTLRVQARLLVEHAMGITPPPKGKSQGQRRTRLDINQLFNPVSYSQMRNMRLARIVKNGDTRGWEAFSNNPASGEFYRKSAVVVSKEFHKRHRDRRGRIRGAGSYVTLTPEQSNLRKLREEKVSKVGWARAGWLAAYQSLGGTRDPEWVRRHGQGGGYFEDASYLKEKPYIKAFNNTEWARRGLESDRIVTNAIKARTKAIDSYFREVMRLASEGKSVMQEQSVAGYE